MKVIFGGVIGDKQFFSFYRQRDVLVTIPLVIALFWPISETPIDRYIWPIGLAIFMIGLLGRIWAQEHLHFRLKMQLTFTNSGPYDLVRNPIYICNTLICIGLTVVSHIWWLVPFTLVWCVALYYFVVREEEANLEHYGEAYQAYLEEVPRWMPRFPRKPLGFVNQYLGRSIVAEVYNFLYLIPFVGKEIVYRWLIK